MAGPDHKELWVGWTQDAINTFEPSEDDDRDETVDAMIDHTCTYADGMLEEYEKRFSSNSAVGRRGRKKRSESSED